MKTVLPLLVSSLLILLSGCGTVARNRNPGVALFNGRNLDGWVIESGGQFSVERGVIKVNRGTGWLRSAEAYSDFELAMQFRFLEQGANSGVFVRTAATSRDDSNGWPDNGYQIQCLDTLEGPHPLGHMIPYGAPPFESQSDLEALKRAYKPAGQWQTYLITCDGEQMAVALNGELITTCTGIKNLTGHIGIQAENGLLEFRRIHLRKIP